MGTCKKCKMEYPKLFSHVSGNGTKRYRDDKGYLWMGGSCPTCYKSSQKLKMRERRAKVE